MSLLATAVIRTMLNLYLPILILFEIFALIAGLLLVIKPNWAIEIQIRFYEKINWRIEPVSMQKEIRNTRIMGFFLITLALLTIIYVLITPIWSR